MNRDFDRKVLGGTHPNLLTVLVEDSKFSFVPTNLLNEFMRVKW
jgi:hypothetical protein